MNIFNSLGSNYDLRYALRALFSVGAKKDENKLKKLLAKKFGGEVHLFYKGREAIEAALKISNFPKKSNVIFNGFTCEVVVNAIKNAGLAPMPLDVDLKSLNFTYEKLKQEARKNENIKVVIVQNTLGNTCEIERVSNFCKKNDILLIEDLAHGIGRNYGDFVCLSFSQDKIIDSVSGGALIIRNKKYQDKFSLKQKRISFLQQIKDRFYPILTWKIRFLYPIGLGKLLHFFLKKIKLLSNPLGKKVESLQSLPFWHSKLVYKYILNLEVDISKRKEVVKIYKKNISKKFILNGDWLIRFPLVTKNRKELILKLKKHGVYVSDIWYEKKVVNNCSISDKLNKTILNLPTHKNISIKKAKKLAGLVNKYAKI